MALVDHLLEMIRKLLAVQKRANRSNSQTLLGISVLVEPRISLAQ